MQEYPKILDEIIYMLNNKNCYFYDIKTVISNLTEIEKKYITDFQESVNILIREENLFFNFDDTKKSLPKLIEQYKDDKGFMESQLYVMLEQLITAIETEKDNDIKKSNEQEVLINYLLLISALVDNKI